MNGWMEMMIINYILTVTSHECLTLNDDNIQYTHVLPPSQGATTATTTSITVACFDPSFDTEQQRSEVLPSPISDCQIIDRSQ